MKLLPCILARHLLGATGGVLARNVGADGSTVIQVWPKKRARVPGRVHPAGCKLHKTADKLYTSMSPWWRPHWQLCKTVMKKSAYDVWMGETLYAYNRAAFAPLVPSASGGHTPEGVIPGGWFPPSVPAEVPASQNVRGTMVATWGYGPYEGYWSELRPKLTDFDGSVPYGFDCWFTSPFCRVHEVRHFDDGFVVRNNVMIRVMWGSAGCWYDWPGTIDWTLRYRTVDFVMRGTFGVKVLAGEGWPLPIDGSAAFRLRANPLTSRLVPVARETGGWAPRVVADVGWREKFRKTGLVGVTVTTAGNERLDRTDRTIVFAVEEEYGGCPAEPAIGVRISRAVQSVGIPADRVGMELWLWYTANLGGAGTWGGGPGESGFTISAETKLKWG